MEIILCEVEISHTSDVRRTGQKKISPQGRTAGVIAWDLSAKSGWRVWSPTNRITWRDPFSKGARNLPVIMSLVAATRRDERSCGRSEAREEVISSIGRRWRIVEEQKNESKKVCQGIVPNERLKTVKSK